MTSILTNNSALSALSQLRDINNSMSTTQNRIASGLKISSAKDNAAYFSVSETMKGDKGTVDAVNEAMTLTTKSLNTAAAGAKSFMETVSTFKDRVAFAQTNALDRGDVQKELDQMIEQLDTIMKTANFNGNDLLQSTDSQTVVTGVSRTGGTYAVTTYEFNAVDLGAIKTALEGVNVDTSADITAQLTTADTQLTAAIAASTDLGIANKTLSNQQDFLSKLSETFESGIGAMVDADMEEEAARLKALQTQQQLANQALSIANNEPQAVLSLFR